MTEKQTLTPIEAINEFYRLKEKYESVYYEKYVKPIVNSDKSKKEKPKSSGGSEGGSAATPAYLVELLERLENEDDPEEKANKILKVKKITVTLKGLSHEN